MPELPLLEVRDLSVSFRTEEGVVRAVDGLSFSLGQGEVLGIVGESGSGKTVSMLSVMRLIRDPNAIVEGQVLHRGRDLIALSQREMQSVRGAEIAMIFQDPMTALTPVYRVGWQIAEQLRAHERLSARAARVRTVELLREVGIPNASRRAEDYPHQFSGGMRQRVMIAMALSCNPVAADRRRADDRARRDDPGADPRADEAPPARPRLLDRAHHARHGRRRRARRPRGRDVRRQRGRGGLEADVFRDPQHPYTWGLLGSMPRIDRPRPRRLAAIPGTPPSLLAPPEGCRFAPRCVHRFELCSTRPALAERVAPGRKDACHLDPPVRPALRQASLAALTDRESA